jgi:hypothetical protein
MSTQIVTPEPNAFLITPDACHSNLESAMEPDPFAGGRVYVPHHRTICSIFPEARELSLMHAGQRKTYRIEGAPKGKYSLLTVYDTWTIVRNTDDPEANENGGMKRAVVPADGLAMDLERAWAMDTRGNESGHRPGFLILEGDKPTQGELESAWITQTEYFRYLVLKAEENWAAGNKSYVTNDHRRALTWLGVSGSFQWANPMRESTLRACPACAEEINVMATVCRFCQTNLVKFFQSVGVEPGENEWPGVVRLLETIKSKKVA